MSDDSEILEAPAGWPVLDPKALHGLAGEVVATLAPHTESDPAAVLVSFLSAFGNAVGPGPYAIADGARHTARIFPVVVGKSSRSRKGTSWRNVSNVMAEADSNWARTRVMSGLSSGEGLIAAVSDGTTDKDGTVIGAVPDKRLLVVEEEFARPLRVKGRDGSTLSAIIRQCYDTGDLRVMTKTPLVATGAHVSVLGHITVDELRSALTDIDATNGFANRFLFACARRSKLLPGGGDLRPDDLAELGRRVGDALSRARPAGRLAFSDDGYFEWKRLYRRVAVEDEFETFAGTLQARAEAHLLRLAVVFALTDGSRRIEVKHIRAAEALWAYCCDSLRYIFTEDSTGDPVADRLYRALLGAGPEGLDRRAQAEVFGGHKTALELEKARKVLKGVAEEVSVRTAGRPRRVLRLVEAP